MVKTLPLLLLLFAGEVSAQRVVAVTAALSVTQEAGRLYGESLDFGAGSALPGPVALEETEVRALMLTHGQVLVTTESQGNDVQTRELAVAPFGEAGRRVEGQSGWAEWPVMELADGLLFLGRQGDFWRSVLRGRDGMEQASLDLPWQPVSWAPAEDNTVAFLCTSDEGPKLLLWQVPSAKVNGGKGAVRSRRLESGPDSEPQLLPGVIGGAQAAPHMLVVLNDSARDKSFAMLIDTSSLDTLAEAVEMPGVVAATANAVATGLEANYWVASQLPGTDFGYVTQLRLEGNAWVKAAEYALSAGPSAPRLAAAPEGSGVAVAFGRRVEVWPHGVRGDAGHAFEDPLGALEWSEEGLVAAESSRVHLLDAETCAPRTSVQLQSGHVQALAVVPRQWSPQPDADADGLTDAEELGRGTLSGIADSDGDGIADGVDPAPRLVSPRLELPARVTLRAAAMGREVRAFPVGTAGLSTAWRVSVPPEAPWLVASPLRGVGTGVVYLGIDPGRYKAPQTENAGTGPASQAVKLTVEMRGALNSPAQVVVEVLPARRRLREILWVWPSSGDSALRDAEDARGIAPLANLLAGAPHFFAHREARGPVRQDLSAYALLVVDIRAAEAGALARQDLLEYLQAGGGVLLIAGETPADKAAAAPSNWLSPLGVRLLHEPTVSGRFDAMGASALARAWRQLPVEQGTRLFMDPGDLVVATGEGEAILAVKSYGYGRAALLAAPTPLQRPAMESQEARQFARVLFEWLAAAGQEVEDMDGDGLLDSVEDVINTGIADPGETDYLRADTDGDGVPDALEDRNRNGRVDEGETDPRNPDSDADALYDGADSVPVPPFGAPQIAQVSPAEAPAEGGVFVVVQGKNFAPDSHVWFGNLQAAAVRVTSPEQVEVEVPAAESPAGGLVEVRVESSAQGHETRLPGGFRYGPRTRLTAALETTVWTGAEQSTGLLRVRLNTGGAPLPAGTLQLTLEAVPRVVWGVAQLWSSAQRREHTLQARPSGAGQLTLQVRRASGGVLHEGPLLRVPWQVDAGAGEVKFRLVRGTLTTETGVVLEVESEQIPAGPPLS